MGGGGPSFRPGRLLDAAVGEAMGQARVAFESPGVTLLGRRAVVNRSELSLMLQQHVMEALAYRGQR